MPPPVTGVAQDASRQSGYLAVRAAPPRGELVAAFAVAALLAQILLAQLTLAFSVCFLIIGRASRWRPWWLLAPAAAGLAWMLSAGVRPAVAGYLAGGGRLIGYLSGSGSALARLAHLPAAFAGWRQWLPRQLPVALVAAAAQATGIGLLGGRPASYRPGLIVAVRRRYLAAMIRGRKMATGDGGCLGLAPGTGRQAAISWREAETGVLCAGQDAATVAASGFELVSAAIARRKTVIIVDLAGDLCGKDHGGWAAERVSAAVQPPGGGLAALVARMCFDAGAPLRTLADPGCRSEPLGPPHPDRATDLVLAMIDWRGVSQVQRQFCASYLRAALAVIATGAGGRPGRPLPVLDELADLLLPGALSGRLGQVPDYRPPAGPLTRRAGELASQLDNDPALIAPMAAQLAALRNAEVGRRLGSAWPAGSPISLRHALADRDVVLFSLDWRLHGRPASMVARLVVADLTNLLAERAALAAPADCLVWISGCEVLDPGQLTALVAAGADAGTAVLLGTAAEYAAIRLASEVNVVVIRGPATPGLARVLGPATPAWPESPARMSFEQADGAGTLPGDLVGQRPDELSLVVRYPRPRILTRCLAAR